MKKKRKRSTSSSTSSDSSSSSSSDSSPSTSRKKSKKRKHKRRRSSRSSKKHKRRVSSCSDKTAEDDRDWFPAPANTSASYINQNQSISKLMSESEPVWGAESRGRFEEDLERGSDRVKPAGFRSGVNGEPLKVNERVGNRRDSSSSTQSEYSHKSERHSEFSGRNPSRSERAGNDGGKTNSANTKKDLPLNLLDIFSQIAEFQKDKKQKK